MRESGVYINITDESFSSVNAVNIIPLVPMRLKKGLPIERVNNRDYVDVVGYDLDFNNSYLGLKKLLEFCSYVDIYRLEHDTYYANRLICVDGHDFTVESADDIDAMELDVSNETDTDTVPLAGSPHAGDVSSKITPGTFKVYDSTGTTLLAEDDGLGVIDDVGTSGFSGTITDYALGTFSLTVTAAMPVDIVYKWVYDSPLALVFSLDSRGAWGDYAVEMETITTTPVLKVYEKTGPSTYALKETFDDISFDSEATNFIELIASDYITVKYVATPTVTEFGDTTPLLLENGDDGTTPSTTDIDSSALFDLTNYFVVGNGIVDPTMLAWWGDWANTNYKIMFYDMADVDTYVAALAFDDSITFHAERTVSSWVVDWQMIDAKEYVIYPSVYLMKSYASMFSATGRIEYPPNRYSATAVTALRATDSALNGDALKQNSINYMTSRNGQVVYWEQRTGYPTESDLSYINTVVTLDTFSARVKSTLTPYLFKLITSQMDLDLIRGALQIIIDEYISFGFIWTVDLDIPTFAEAVEAGIREANIKFIIKFGEDTEEFIVGITIGRSG
jgi:hypothetical protein